MPLKPIAVPLLALSLLAPAYAAAPQSGTVFEGDRVPGVALGDSRATVEASIGPPQFCQSVEVAGDRASCNFPVDGGGTASIRYRGADGGNAGNRPGDVVHAIRWYEAVSGWVTTAGIDTAIAAADPDAVTAAYPDGEVTYNLFGDIYRLTDAALGIEVIWALDFYTGTTHVNMAVFGTSGGGEPPPPPAPDEAQVRVTDIDIDGRKRKRNREASATVELRDDSGHAAAAALVRATWRHPDGREESGVDVTSLSGYAHFATTGDRRGTYTLRIDSVELEDHDFDADGSVLEASVDIR